MTTWAGTIGARAALVLAALLLTAPAMGQDAAPDAGPREWLAQQPAPSTRVALREESMSPWRMAAMVALVGALGAAAFYMKRKREQLVVRHGSPELAIVSSARLGPKSQVVLASVSGRMILLGVTENSVQKLAWIDPVRSRREGAPLRPSRAEEPATAPPARTEPFSRVLRELLDEIPENPPPNREPEPVRQAPQRDSTPAVRRGEAAVRPPVTPSLQPRSAATLPPVSRSVVPATDLEGQVLGLTQARKARR